MSYNFAIVVPPVTADDAAAWAELDALIEQEGPRPPVFQELHDRLTARFPCICSVPDDEVDDAVWSDGPLINNFTHRAAVLGLSDSRVEEVLPFAIATANNLGLVLFDWATGKIHRSDGPESCFEQKLPWKKTEVRRAIAEALDPVLRPAGFRSRKQVFARRIPGGKQEIGVSLIDYNPRFEFNLVFTIRLDEVEGITNPFSGVSPKDESFTDTTVTRLEYFLPIARRGFVVTTADEIRSALEQILPALKEKSIPFLDRHQDVKSLNQAMNHDSGFDTSFHPYRGMEAVTLAHLAGDPDFDILVERYQAEMRTTEIESQQDKFRKLVEHLRALRQG